MSASPGNCGATPLDAPSPFSRRNRNSASTPVDATAGPARGVLLFRRLLKARFCRDGNRALRDYITSRGLALNPCGKLVVARSEADHPQLDELLRRGTRNGVRLQPVSAEKPAALSPG